jgi:hypothetical protein
LLTGTQVDRPNRIRLIDKHGVAERVVTVQGGYLSSLEWDATGAGFYIGQSEGATWRLLHLGLDGVVHVLMSLQPGSEFWALLSPDGRMIATSKEFGTENVWMVENP